MYLKYISVCIYIQIPKGSCSVCMMLSIDFWELPRSAFDLWLIYLAVSSCLSLRVCGYDCGWYLCRSFPLIRSHHTGKKLLILSPFSSLCITWICIYFVQNYLSTLSKCLTMRKELILV